MSLARPFGDLWYVLSLAQFIAWRPFATEMRHSVVVHALLGCVMGYTTVGRFLSLTRTVTHLPFFLLGHAMRRHGVFFSWAASVPARTFAASVFLAALGGCAAAVYAFHHRTSIVWEMSHSYQFVWGPKYKWGFLIQLGVYAAGRETIVLRVCARARVCVDTWVVLYVNVLLY